jgi:HlyD family secretion protein
VGGILSLVLVAFAALAPARNSADIRAEDIETATVTRGPFQDYVAVRATVAPSVTTFVGVMTAGRVERVMAQDGSEVFPNQPLAVLANPELRLEIAARQAEIAGKIGDISGSELALQRSRHDSLGQIQQARFDSLTANRQLALHKRLQHMGDLTEEGVRGYEQQARFQAERLAQLEAAQIAEAKIAQTQASRLSEARGRLAASMAPLTASLDALTIRAPVAGRLTNFTLQPGQMLKAGDPAGQVDSEQSWKLVADVDEYYLGRVAVGQHARSESGLDLTVSRIVPAVTNGRFKVEFTFNRPPPATLSRGQTLDIRLTLGGGGSAVLAPVGGWLESGGGASVFVLDSGGTHARRRAIRVGRRNPENVEVLDGLSPGERIVISNTSQITGNVLNLR